MPATEDQYVPFDPEGGDARIIAATLVSAMAANKPGLFADPSAVWNAYVRLFERVKAEGDQPRAVVAGAPILGLGDQGAPASLQLQTMRGGLDAVP